MKSRRGKLTVALLGLDHPHAPLLLRTLHNLPEIGAVLIWKEHGRAPAPWASTAKSKIVDVTARLRTILDRDDVHFVIVCVRHDLAARVAERAIRSGHHVLMEKPAGLNSREIARLGELAERQKVEVGVFYGQRVHPAVQAARTAVAAGRIGSLLAVEARMVTTQVRFRDPGSWLFRRGSAGGGILTWLGCHYLDLIPYITGDEIVAVSAELATRSGENIEVEDAAMLTLRFRSGAVGSFHAGYLLAGRGAGYRNPAGFENYLACSGQNGRVVWRGMKSRTLLLETEQTGTHSAPQRLRFRLPASDSYGGAVGDIFMRRFIAAVCDGGTLPATLEDAGRVMRILEAAYRSARTRQTQAVR